MIKRSILPSADIHWHGSVLAHLYPFTTMHGIIWRRDQSSTSFVSLHGQLRKMGRSAARPEQEKKETDRHRKEILGWMWVTKMLADAQQLFLGPSNLKSMPDMR